MDILARKFVRIYLSDGAFTAALLLAFGLLGATYGMSSAVLA